MSVRKPKPKYGWTEEVALQHSEEPIKDKAEWITEAPPSGKGYTCMPPQPKGVHGSRLEAILRCEARASMNSPAVQWGLEELKRTGARRVILDRDPSHSRWYTN